MHYLLLMVNCNNVIISYIEKQTLENARHMLSFSLCRRNCEKNDKNSGYILYMNLGLLYRLKELTIFRKYILI